MITARIFVFYSKFFLSCKLLATLNLYFLNDLIRWIHFLCVLGLHGIVLRWFVKTCHLCTNFSFVEYCTSLAEPHYVKSICFAPVLMTRSIQMKFLFAEHLFREWWQNMQSMASFGVCLEKKYFASWVINANTLRDYVHIIGKFSKKKLNAREAMEWCLEF